MRTHRHRAVQERLEQRATEPRRYPSGSSRPRFRPGPRHAPAPEARRLPSLTRASRSNQKMRIPVIVGLSVFGAERSPNVSSTRNGTITARSQSSTIRSAQAHHQAMARHLPRVQRRHLSRSADASVPGRPGLHHKRVPFKACPTAMAPTRESMCPTSFCWWIPAAARRPLHLVVAIKVP